MKVLHVFKDLYPPLAAGITCYVHDVAGETVRRGHEVEVHVAGVRKPVREVLPNGVIVHRHREVGRLLSMPMAPGLVTGPRGTDADVVHVHMPNPIGEVGPLLNGHRVPVVASFHARLGRQRFLEPAYRPLRRALLGRATTVLVSSEAMARSPELAGVRDKVVVLPYGVSPRLLTDGAHPVADGDTLRLLYVGRLVYYKGLEVLIRALAAAPSPRPWQLTVVGDGPLRVDLEHLAAGLGLNGDVRFRGSVGDDELRRAYASHDVFVLPSVSRAEAFGLAMAEAMANGMPVVSTELDTGTSWVNADGVSGLVVAPGDVAALGQALERLRPAAARAPLAAGARHRARELFCFQEHCDRLMGIYERAAASRH